MFEVPGSGFQIQIARRHIELNLEVGHVASARTGQASIREENTGRTAQGLHRGLHSNGEANAAYPEKIGVESIGCAGVRTPWTVGEKRWCDLDQRANRTDR